MLGLELEHVSAQMPGFNHWIWMTDFRYKGQNAYPLLDEWIATKAEAYWATQAASFGDNQMSRAAIHQYQLFGLMPIGDTPAHGRLVVPHRPGDEEALVRPPGRLRLGDRLAACTWTRWTRTWRRSSAWPWTTSHRGHRTRSRRCRATSRSCPSSTALVNDVAGRLPGQHPQPRPHHPGLPGGPGDRVPGRGQRRRHPRHRRAAPAAQPSWPAP